MTTLLFVIFIIAFFVIFFFGCKEVKHKNFGDYITVSLLSLLASMGVTLLALLILHVIGEAQVKNHPEITQVQSEHYLYIYSIEDNSNISGSFVLGSGSVNEKPVYTFYYKTKHGYKIGTVSADISYIKEIKGIKTPEIIDECDVPIDGSFWKGFKFNDRYIIMVPEGTIIKRFNLDSKY